VVARHETDVLCWAQGLKPIATLPKFRGKGDICDIAGDRDVVRLLRFDVGDDRRKFVPLGRAA
jgi:hypothetical protein